MLNSIKSSALAEKLAFVVSGTADARIISYKAALYYWNSLSTQAFSMKTYQKAGHTQQNSIMTFYMQIVHSKLRFLSPTTNAPWVTYLEKYPRLLLAQTIDSPALDTTNTKDELRLYWEFYRLSRLSPTYPYPNTTMFPLQNYGIPLSIQDAAQVTPITIINTFVVVDQGVVELYGSDYAEKIKRNIEVWDDPFTVRFGISLDVRAVLHLPDEYNSHDVQTYYYGPLGSPYNVKWIPTRSFNETINFYLNKSHSEYVPILGRQEWKEPIGTQQNYDLLIVVLGYPRRDDVNNDGDPLAGAAKLNGNFLVFSLRHAFWKPQLTFLHELSHVFGARHPAKQIIGGIRTEAVPDGTNDNPGARDTWAPEDTFLEPTNTNADESGITPDDWYLNPTTNTYADVWSILDYYDNYVMSVKLKNIFSSLLSATKGSYTYDSDGNNGDYQSTLVGLVRALVGLPPSVDSVSYSAFVQFDYYNEQEILSNRNQFANSDIDNDGLTNQEEWTIYHTDPTNNDTDGDGLSDGEELFTQFPYIQFDTTLGYYQSYANTDPTKYDTDGDGLPDHLEVAHFSNPSSIDTDNDGYTDKVEAQISKFINGKLQYIISFPNTDGDSYLGTPLYDMIDGDSDNDGLLDYQENNLGTNWRSADTDGDGLKDGAEVSTYHTNPKTSDTDNDGLSDADEIITYGTNPTDPDTDHDGHSDSLEISRGYDPNDPNDPLNDARLRPTAVSSSDEKDSVSATFQKPSRHVAYLKVYVRFYNVRWTSYYVFTIRMTAVRVGDTVTWYYRLTTPGIYTRMQMVIYAYTSDGYLLGSYSTGSYSIRVTVGGHSGGGGGTPKPPIGPISPFKARF